MAKAANGTRREEILDGVMTIVSARGFSDVRIADIASELHCSLASLYRIAPNKDSLVVLAIGRWGERVLARAEASAAQGASAADRAQSYWTSAAKSISPLSHVFRRDVEKYESTRLAYLTYSNRFVDTFAGLLKEASDAGEVQSVNARFMAGLFRHVAASLRDEDLLESAGLTAAEAAMEIDRIIWEGLRACPPEAQMQAATSRPSELAPSGDSDES